MAYSIIHVLLLTFQYDYFHIGGEYSRQVRFFGFGQVVLTRHNATGKGESKGTISAPTFVFV